MQGDLYEDYDYRSGDENLPQPGTDNTDSDWTGFINTVIRGVNETIRTVHTTASAGTGRTGTPVLRTPRTGEIGNGDTGGSSLIGFGILALVAMLLVD